MCHRTALVVLPFVAVCGLADVLTIESTFSSGFKADGSYTPGFMNYYTGYSVPSTPVERRNWFIFDLSGVSEPIVSATLKLYMPGDPDHPGEPCGYISPDPTEDYLVTTSTFHWTAFAEAFGMPLPPPMIVPLYESLGTGVPFALATVSGDACGSDVEMEVTPEGLAGLNAAIGDSIVVGGRLTDLLDTPGTPPSELAFAYTDIPSPLMPFPRLEIVTVPEPATGILTAIGAALLAGGRRLGARPAARTTPGLEHRRAG